jgi:hypothetical protein
MGLKLSKRANMLKPPLLMSLVIVQLEGSSSTSTRLISLEDFTTVKILFLVFHVAPILPL